MRGERLRRALCGSLALVAALGFTPAVASGDDGGWYVVAFEDRITGADRARLEGTGARALMYHPRDAYTAWIDARRVSSVRAIARVASVHPLHAGEKLHPFVSGSDGPMRASVLVERRAVPAVSRVLPGVLATGAAAGLGEIVVVANADELRRTAARSDVLFVGPAPLGLFPEDEQGDQIVAGNISDGRPVPGYTAWLAGHGLDGSGVRMSVVDTGVDSNHPDLTGRVSHVDYRAAGGVNDLGGHGTHVAGIVAGAGYALPGAGTLGDLSGFAYGLGVAPEAEIVDQNAIGVLSEIGLNQDGFLRIARDSVAAGSGGWNASWHSGEGTNAGYIASAATMDAIVRDGDQVLPGEQPLALVFSAGNSGPEPKTITSPHEAKNIIAVGSSIGARTPGMSIDRISTFSSRGPAADGRIVPTVSAPGETITSARSLTPALACNMPSPPLGAGLYATCSGTSMAAPHVTGAVALLTQWWRRTHGTGPSPAMSKALLVNSATDMGDADVPNGDEGWGRVNLGTLFDPTLERHGSDQAVVFDDPGDSYTVDVQVVDPSRPLRATLVWTDAPGAPGSSPALVNDLDLTLAAGLETFHGNHFEGGRTVAGGASDTINNVENVWLPDASGVFEVTVSAANLPGDGVPGAGDATDQDFALVLSNAILV